MAYAVPKDYTWELKIASYDAGRDRRLRPSNQLKLQQEVGELHLGIGGLDYDAFYQHGMVFVLTRTRTVIHRAPLLDEHVKLRTWHRDSQGAQFFRCYQFLDSGERPLIESVSAFALVDSETHKILRASAFDRLSRSGEAQASGGAGPGRGASRPLVGYGLQPSSEQHRVRGYFVRLPARQNGGQALDGIRHFLFARGRRGRGAVHRDGSAAGSWRRGSVYARNALPRRGF